ncbi:MAG: TIGR01777 family oxidoreductase [Gemmatimonadota bacterium]|nr:TIGR01777 family oxidoreductase [Gemmatimonadota bacterium]MDE2870288.1 TIGR01777 family oxidoreductase [Gemmatimonadota bacterium]
MPRIMHEAELPFPVEQAWDWHMRPGALERLMPPWEDARVVGREGGIGDGGTVHLRVRRGPVKVDFKVRHTEFEPGRLFTDEQYSGPMGSWVHRHEFEPRGGGACLIRDRIAYEPPLGSVTAALAGSALEGEAKRLFRFRNRRLVRDLARHAAYDGPPLRVAVTGASGFIGSALRHFLTTGGHEVLPIVRRRPDRDLGEVYWDPMERKIEGARLEGVDALVHLAGESLSRGRWTPVGKEAIWKSRVVGTRVLADALNRLRDPPRVFVSSSAVGYYGNRGSERLVERSRPGKGFLADLCREWENEAFIAGRSGVRVVVLRTGLVLSPAGGALGTMLLPFKMGIGGRLGSGRQYVSWIDHDDLVALIFHALVTPSLRGPVNATAPHPVTNATFTTKLGHVLRRPTLLPVPSLAVRGLFGEMGGALLLDGARVLPEAAMRDGFRFDFEGIGESLAFQLGRRAPGS